MISQIQKATLLVVEDEDEVRELIVELLQPLGYVILTASNGHQALDIVRSGQVDTILSDLRMPMMDGLQLLFEVRNLGLETPFMLLTGYGDKNSAIMALRLGAFDFLEKPFEPGELLKQVQRAMDYGMRLRTLDAELGELCMKAKLPPSELDAYRKSKRAILLLRKQRGA